MSLLYIPLLILYFFKGIFPFQAGSQAPVCRRQSPIHIPRDSHYNCKWSILCPPPCKGQNHLSKDLIPHNEIETHTNLDSCLYGSNNKNEINKLKINK